MANSLTELLKSRLVPTDALIFYRPTIDKKKKNAGGAFVEYRQIHEGQMGAGCPLEINTLAKIMKTVDNYVHNHTSMVTLHGKIPEGLLYASTNLEGYRLVWYRKPEKRFMYFTERLNIPNGEMQVPGMVYSTDGQKLSVFCFKGNKPKAVLYKAPFFNVSDNVCLGTAKVKKPTLQTYENWIEYWETMFWKSEFNHILGNNPVRDNLAVITKECIKTGKPFPLKQLIRSKVTLQQLLG